MKPSPRFIDSYKLFTEQLKIDKETSGIVPILCYALDDRFMPDEVYNEWEKCDIKNFVEVNSKNPEYKHTDYLASFILYWFKKNYKKGNGYNIYMILGDDMNKHPRNQLIKLLQKDSLSKDSVLYSCRKKILQKTALTEWFRSQCWIISRELKSERAIKGQRQGGTSVLTKNNKAICRYLRQNHDFFSMSLEDINEDDSLNISFEDLCLECNDLQDGNNNYLKWIWENHQKTYISSLKALISKDETPAKVKGTYLGTLWGTDIGLLNMDLEAEWQLDENGSYSLGIHYTIGDSIKKAYLRQDDKSKELMDKEGWISDGELKALGFNCQGRFELCPDNKRIANSIPIMEWSEEDPLIFDAKKMTRMRNVKYAKQIIVVCENAPKSLQFDETSCHHSDRKKIRESSFLCFIYDVPDKDCTLFINGKAQLRLRRMPVLELMNPADIHLYRANKKNYSKEFVIGNRAKLHLYNVRLLRPTVPEEISFLIKGHQGELTLIDDQYYYKENKIKYKAYIDPTQQPRTKTIIFLPENWKRDCKEAPLKERIECAKNGFSLYLLQVQKQEAQMCLVTPISQAVWYWEQNGREHQDRLNEYDENCKLTVLAQKGANQILILRLKNKKTIEIRIECNLAVDLDFILKNQLNPCDDFELLINNECICCSVYRPCVAMMTRNVNNELCIYAHPDVRSKAKLTIKHESTIIKMIHEQQVEKHSSRELSLAELPCEWVWDNKHVLNISQYLRVDEGWFFLSLKEGGDEFKEAVKMEPAEAVNQRLDISREWWIDNAGLLQYLCPELANEIELIYGQDGVAPLSSEVIYRLLQKSHSAAWEQYQNNLKELSQGKILSSKASFNSVNDPFPIDGLFHLGKDSISSVKFQAVRDKGLCLWYCNSRSKQPIKQLAFLNSSVEPQDFSYYKQGKSEKIDKLADLLCSWLVSEYSSFDLHEEELKHCKQLILKFLKSSPLVGRLAVEDDRIHALGSLILLLWDRLSRKNNSLATMLMLAVWIAFDHHKDFTTEESNVLLSSYRKVNGNDELIDVVLRLSLLCKFLIACFPCKK